MFVYEMCYLCIRNYLWKDLSRLQPQKKMLNSIFLPFFLDFQVHFCPYGFCMHVRKQTEDKCKNIIL
jgi:hypothetical protein